MDRIQHPLVFQTFTIMTIATMSRHRVEFRAQDGAVDDCEWYFVDPESDAIIEFRSARRGDKGDNGTNLRRLEKIRIALGFEKVRVDVVVVGSKLRVGTLVFH